MRLGVILPSTTPDGSAFTGETLIAQARTTERVGFTSLWCFDAIGLDDAQRMRLFEEALPVSAAPLERRSGRRRQSQPLASYARRLLSACNVLLTSGSMILCCITGVLQKGISSP